MGAEVVVVDRREPPRERVSEADLLPRRRGDVGAVVAVVLLRDLLGEVAEATRISAASVRSLRFARRVSSRCICGSRRMLKKTLFVSALDLAWTAHIKLCPTVTHTSDTLQ